MSKKFFPIGLTVLLGMSLFLTACPREADDDSGGAPWYDSLGDSVSVDGNTVTLTGNKVLNESVTVPSGQTFVVPESKSLTVNAGTFSVNSGGTFDVAGTLTLSGEGGLGGAIVVGSGGKFIAETSLTGTNDSTITIKNGGEAWAKDNQQHLDGDGYIVVEYGGKAYQTLPTVGKTLIIGKDGETALFQLTAANSTISFNNTSFKLKGQGRFTAPYTLAQVLTIEANSTLTIGAALITNTNNTGRFLGIGATSTITTESGGSIVLQGASSKNFYPSSGNTAEGSVGASKTYKWNTNANGSGTAGWKATS